MSYLRTLAFFCALGPWSVQAQSIPNNPGAPLTATSFHDFKEAYTVGNQMLDQRNFRQAAQDYGQAEALTSDESEKSVAANSLGWVLLKSKDWKGAETAFDRAVEEDPQNMLALKNLGVVNFRLYEYDLAGIDELKLAIKNLTSSGEDDELLERAQGALSLEQGYAQATPIPEPKLAGMSFKSLLNLGDCLQSEGQFETASKVFKKAEEVGLSPSAKATAINRQGKVLLDAREASPSIPFFEKAVQLMPKEKTYWNNLGFAYWVVYDSGKGGEAELKKSVAAYYQANSLDASFQSENLDMALNELTEIDPQAAQAYRNPDLDDDPDDAGDGTPTPNGSDPSDPNG